MLAAVVNTGYSLGGTLAPIVSGSVMQSYGFEFDPIIASILCFLIVSDQVVCFKFLFHLSLDLESYGID